MLMPMSAARPRHGMIANSGVANLPRITRSRLDCRHGFRSDRIAR
nr:hypothetical protein RSP673_08255 [Ralstonia solanacearum P673]